MSDPGWISVVRWKDFQTYDTQRSESGRPPWIKIYTRLLDDDEYLNLSAKRRAILHGIWLLYAASGCKLSASPARLGARLGLWTGADEDSPGRSGVRRGDLAALEQAGFICIVARKENAEGAQPARASRVREEVEVEEELNQVPAEQSRSKTTARPGEDEIEPEWAGADEPPPDHEDRERWNGATDVPRLEPIAPLGQSGS